MSNFIQYRSNYFDYFKTFKYNAKLLKAHLHNLIQIKLANEILENATTAALLKYLSNVWISHKVSLINCRFELKPKRTKHFVHLCLVRKMVMLFMIMSFSLSKTQNCIPVVTLSAQGNQKLSERLSKRLERSTYWNECKTKTENKLCRS